MLLIQRVGMEFLGKVLSYSDPGLRKLSLFRVGKGNFEKRLEDQTSNMADMEIHEHPIIKGSVGQIKSCILHKDYKGLEHYIARHNAYSSWEAKRFMNLKKDKFTKLTLRQNLKYSLIQTGLLPYLYFIGTYIFKVGVLDGLSGFYFDWTADAPPHEIYGDNRRIGLSAQNVHSVYPELVQSGAATGPSGDIPDFMTVSYERLAGVFVQALQELDSKVETLKSQVDNLD